MEPGMDMDYIGRERFWPNVLQSNQSESFEALSISPKSFVSSWQKHNFDVVLNKTAGLVFKFQISNQTYAVVMHKTNVTIIASPKMPKKYVLEYEGKNSFPC